MYKRKFEDDSNKENVVDSHKKTCHNEDYVCIVLSDNEEEDAKKGLNEKNSKCTDDHSESENHDDHVLDKESLEKLIDEIDSNSKNENSDEDKLNYEILGRILKDTKQVGDYAVGDEATNLPPILGLEIEGFGPVSLPLVEPNASDLIKLCSQAPYGHNFDTVVDKNVRDSYQLNPNQIKINNKNWTTKLNELVKKVCIDLGVKGSVEIKLYKMLIYEKGGHFLKHRDTEKENGMFATLVLQLPSIHEGGELVVYNRDQKKVYDFGQSTGNAPYLIHYAAHYADLEHELLEVKSGYRTALVYSLCWKDGNGFCPSINIELDSQLSIYLSKLSKTNKRLAICLDHQYTPQALMKNGLTALKGIDNDRMNLLKIANEQLPADEQYSFYIAHANLIIDLYSGFEPSECSDGDLDNSSDWEESQRTRLIESWYNAQGIQVMNSVKVDVNFFHKILSPGLKNLNLDDKKFWNMESDEMEGYTGNEGTNKTTTYGKYFLAMWPKKIDFNVLLAMDPNNAINLFLNRVPNQNDNEFIKKLDLTFSALKQKPIFLETKNVINLMKILEKFDDLAKCKFLLENCVKKMDLIFLKSLSNLVKKYEWFNLCDSLKVLMERGSSSSSSFSYSFWRNKNNSTQQVYNPIQINCNLTKNFLDKISKIVALKFYNQFVVPILNKLDPFPSSSDLILLIQTVKLFPEQQESQLDQIKSALMAIKGSAVLGDHLKQLIKSFSVDSLKKFKEVFEYHLSNLNSIIANHKEFSWEMPLASMFGHSEVEKFLRSNEYSMDYSYYGFGSLSNARRFAATYSSESDSRPKFYSVKMQAEGRGNKAFVRITKTKDYYQNQLKEVAKAKEDVKLFSSLISRF